MLTNYYTLHGYGDKDKYCRYVQESIWTGKPVIKTSAGYRASDVILFNSIKDAETMIAYMTANSKNFKNYKWSVDKYICKSPYLNLSERVWKAKEVRQ